MEGIIASVITGFMSLFGVFVATVESNKKFESKMQTSQAVTDCKIDELTRELTKHNSLVEKIPVLEEQVRALTKSIDKNKHDEWMEMINY